MLKENSKTNKIKSKAKAKWTMQNTESPMNIFQKKSEKQTKTNPKPKTLKTIQNTKSNKNCS